MHVQCNQSHDIINATITKCEKEKALTIIRLLLLTTNDRMKVCLSYDNKITVNRKCPFFWFLTDLDKK